MAIKEVDKELLKRPVELLREDFKEFDKLPKLKVVELIGYENFNQESVRTAGIKVMHEYDDKIKFFSRKKKFYLAK